MSDMKFDHIGLEETIRHWRSLQYENIIPQRFRGHLMSHKLDLITACNKHDSFIDMVPDVVIWTVNWLHYLNYEVIPRSSSTCHLVRTRNVLGQIV